MKKIPLKIYVIFCLTLGLAPFNPPHIYEKLVILFEGNLSKPIDIFDLLLHGTPWILLVLKMIILVRSKQKN